MTYSFKIEFEIAGSFHVKQGREYGSLDEAMSKCDRYEDPFCPVARS